MKLKFTPLLILSIVLILLGIPFILTLVGGNLGPLVGMLIIAAGLICLLSYFFLRKVFQTKVKNQVITELLLISIILLIYYRGHDNVILHIPKNFQGYVMLVYGVDKKPKLKSINILSPNIDLTIPQSGIIFTSTKFPKSVIIIDSSRGELKTVHPGYGLPSASDTLSCGNKNYTLDVFVIGNLPSDWNYNTDTVRRYLTKEVACKLLSE